MEKRTAEIIMVCKGRHNLGRFPYPKNAVRAYLAGRCGLLPGEIDARGLHDVIWDAARDYVAGACPSSVERFFAQVKDAYDRSLNPLCGRRCVSVYEAICEGFSLVKLRNDDGFMDGFTEENTKIVSRVL